MKIVRLTNNNSVIAVVSDQDYPLVRKHNWRLNPDGYPITNLSRKLDPENHKQTVIQMARLILDAPVGVEVDHIDCCPLNNTRKNLRCVSHEQNQYHRLKSRKRKYTSRYKGVHWHSRSKRWRAGITKKRQISLGNFNNEAEAAEAYNKAAKQMFGEYALLNDLCG